MEDFNPEPDNREFHSPTEQQSNKKKWLVLGSVVVLVLLLAGSAAAIYYGRNQNSKDNSVNDGAPIKTEQSQPAMVSITETGFVPQTIHVKKGQTVTWTNVDSRPHQVATDPYPQENGLDGFVAPAPALKDDSYSFTFDKAGSYTYHDKLNYEKFRGTVVVE